MEFKKIGIVILYLFLHQICFSQEKNKISVHKYKYKDSGSRELFFSSLNIEKLKDLDFNYPNIAKQKYWQQNSMFLFELDSTYKVKNIENLIGSDDSELFDSVGLKVISKLRNFQFDSNKAHFDFKKNDSSLIFNINLNYTISFDSLNEKLYFKNSLRFKNSDSTYIWYSKIVDSTNSFKSFYYNTLLERNYSNYYNMPQNNKLALLGLYGRCKFGFWVDTLGQISDLVVVKSTNERIEKEALKNFNSLPIRWIPARENGIKQKTYNELTLRFGYEQASYAKTQAQIYIENKKPEKAIKELESSKEYFDNDINLLYKIVKLKIENNQFETICKDLEEIKYLAIDRYYPKSVSEAKVDELIKLACPQIQE